MADFSTLAAPAEQAFPDFAQALAPGQPSNLEAAHEALDLNPQERALYQRHVRNLYGPDGVDHPDGARSTLYQSVEQHNGRFYNVPTVWGGKIEAEPYKTPDGRVVDVPNATALANIEKHGWDNFPSYATPDEADARYEAMHHFMDQDTSQFLAGRKR